jgi:hypothetical protein
MAGGGHKGKRIPELAAPLNVPGTFGLLIFCGYDNDSMPRIFSPLKERSIH